jgi:hypothetical protein
MLAWATGSMTFLSTKKEKTEVGFQTWGQWLGDWKHSFDHVETGLHQTSKENAFQHL